jgi:hypothetical protein
MKMNMRKTTTKAPETVTAEDTIGNAYPPAPWSLRGEMFVALLRMPAGTVPDSIRPAGIRLGRPDRGMLLAAAFVNYREGGMLAYREFLVATTSATMTAGTILKIWVDSPESVAGGRDLWYIPKELADFRYESDRGFAGTVLVDGQEAASYTFTPKFTVPGRWRMPNTVVQERDGVVRRTRSSLRARLQLGSGSLEIPEDSPVAFLRHGKVVRHVAMRNMTARFGVKTVQM